MPKNTIINLTYLNDLSGGDIDFIKEMLEIFQLDAKIFIDKAFEDLASNNFIELEKSAHKARVSFKTLGMDAASNNTFEIERISKHNPSAHAIKGLLDLVNNDVIIALQEVERMLLTSIYE